MSLSRNFSRVACVRLSNDVPLAWDLFVPLDCTAVAINWLVLEILVAYNQFLKLL